jgi:predicted O-methyltransferase YrrM
VIEEKTPYYVFEDIENFRKGLINGDNPSKILIERETQHKNYGALLFRLVNFFKCRNVLQIGSSTGMMSLYLALPLRNSCECYALEERQGLQNSVRTFVENHSLKKLHLVEGAYKESLTGLKSKFKSFDFIFINTGGDSEKTWEAFHLTETFISPDTVIVIDSIRKDKAMKRLWREIKNRPDVGQTIDLFSLGLVFFNTRSHKQHYKNYFDDGKKQNLYEKRRRRLYIFGRRRKSVQSQSTH